ncbi:MAG: nucleotidyltransferase family protein [Chloroflexi bacterium]|nr:nucleotidyltransferase family protein [Chloroflexota bacterium]
MAEGTEKPRIAAVLLAAGESTRMGEPKALLPWGGQPLIAHQVSALHEAGYAPLVVVLGHGAERVAEALPDHITLDVAINARYEQGRTTSIVLGVLRLIEAGVDGVVIASVDQPRSAGMLRTLREAFERERPQIAVPSLGGRPGHPPLFSGGLLPELLKVSEETEGLRQVMRDFGEGRLLVPVDDPLTLTNLNTHEEYEAALKPTGG